MCSRALKNAKYEYVLGTHVHKDPLPALCTLKSHTLKNAIHAIGAHPFHIWYSSVQQLHIYMAYCRANEIDAKIDTDATGKVVCKIIRPDGSISGNIFL